MPNEIDLLTDWIVFFAYLQLTRITQIFYIIDSYGTSCSFNGIFWFYFSVE